VNYSRAEKPLQIDMTRRWVWSRRVGSVPGFKRAAIEAWCGLPSFAVFCVTVCLALSSFLVSQYALPVLVALQWCHTRPCI
jgi:hypothetical protein